MIFVNFHELCSTRVSNELGGGQPKAARLAVMVSLVMVTIEGVLVVAAMMLVRNIWGSVYTNDEHVVRYVASTMPILAISCFLDGIQSVLSGFLYNFSLYHPYSITNCHILFEDKFSHTCSTSVLQRTKEKKYCSNPLKSVHSNIC